MLRIGQFVYCLEVINHEAISEHGDTLTEIFVHFGRVDRFSKDNTKIQLSTGYEAHVTDVCENEQEFRDMLTYRVGDGSDVWYKLIKGVDNYSCQYAACDCSHIAEDEWGDRFVDYEDDHAEAGHCRVYFVDKRSTQLNMNQMINQVYRIVESFVKADEDLRPFDFPHAYRINYDFSGTDNYSCPNCGERNADWVDSEYYMDARSWEDTCCGTCGCRVDRYWRPTVIDEIRINPDEKDIWKPEDKSEDPQNSDNK